MDTLILPATTYISPSRQARKYTLNTIIEDESSESEEEQQRDDRGRNRSPQSSRSTESYSPVPSLTSTISSYYKTHRRSQDFDDLYDVSDSEQEQEIDRKAAPLVIVRPPSTHSDAGKRDSMRSSTSSGLSLVIPDPDSWPTIQKLQKNSSIPPTPPAKIPISPAVLSLLSQNLPTSTAPPSLDGSLTSDQIACSTAPATPEMQCLPLSAQHWDPVRVSEDSFRDDQSNNSNDIRTPDIEIQLDDSVRWNTDVYDFGSAEEVVHGDSIHVAPESPILGFGDTPEVEETELYLPLGAMDTLRHLSLNITSEPVSPVEDTTMQEMQENTARPRSAIVSPASPLSFYSISQLSIPSPGGFFASLGAGARHTWCSFGSYPPSAAPISSTTAERFYNLPWTTGSQFPVERIIEIDAIESSGPSTARRIPLTAKQSTFSNHACDEHEDRLAIEADSDVQEIDLVKPVQDMKEGYEQEIWHVAEANLDRTSVWLAAQTSYMAALRETNPVNDKSLESGSISRHGSRHTRDTSLGSPMKKVVRFLDDETARVEKSKSITVPKGDPLFYHAFQHVVNDTYSTDPFIHRQTRCEALQASRVSLTQGHVDQLLGRYSITDVSRPTQSRPISMMPGKGTGDDSDQTVEQRVIARIERERQALDQVTAAIWIIEASKYLYGGRLLNSPIVDVLRAAPSLTTKIGIKSERVRVLDLGGQSRCDWAWYCAREYPNTRVYTATGDQDAMLSNLPGPSNYRLVSVGKLWQLPFPNGHFDAISARSLFAVLKNEKPLGGLIDEYDMCLSECLRCLKPGGFFEFFVLDSEIVHSGPRGTAVSVEFGFNLKARGYDPSPTKSWLGRVRKAGLVDIKRAWMFLPVGAAQQEAYIPPEAPPPNIIENDHIKLEAVRGPVGSTANAANISGLVGSWAWEQWLLRLQIEMGKENLLDGVGAALEEGKATGAGWRCLSGWARKPTEQIQPV